MSRRFLVTGGMGFIGTNLVKYIRAHYPGDPIVVFDCMTYASRPSLLSEDEYTLEKVDIRDQASLCRAILKHQPTHVYHLAAESHVCRSIAGPRDFIHTNVMGTWNLMEELRHYGKAHRIVHVSTDEVFGEAADGQFFTESTQIAPRSPYAASKAASDHIALSYHSTYRMPIMVTNCSNNFGSNQHEEKLIPKTIMSMLAEEPVTLYGDGQQVRDWIWVGDHCDALDRVMREGRPGERYCIGGDIQMTNERIVQEVADSVARVTGKGLKWTIKYTDDRPTDDRRYAINNKKIHSELKWSPKKTNFRMMLDYTVRWYCGKLWSREAGAAPFDRHKEAEVTQ